jgi:hypothetical protein
VEVLHRVGKELDKVAVSKAGAPRYVVWKLLIYLARREEHKSEHGFGEPEMLQILRAVNQGEEFGDDFRREGFSYQ